MSERTTAQHPELDLAAPYALDALDMAERREFEAHLATCAACRAEVAAFRETVGALAHAAPSVAPPPALRERVLAEARATRPDATPASLPVIPLRTGRRTSVVPWLAAAAALLLAAGLGWQLGRERAERRALVAELAVVEQARDDARARAASTDSLLDLVLSPAATSAKLAATGQPPSMQLVWHRVARVVVLSAADLPPARAGRTYQLWAIAPGSPPRSLGTFNTRPDGAGRAVLRATPETMAAVQASAVTEEPAGGSPQPTTQPFLVGNWGAAR